MKKLLLIIYLLFSLISNSNAAEKFDFIVALDGSGNFNTIQSAIDACKAFPDNPIVIFVKNGINIIFKYAITIGLAEKNPFDNILKDLYIF